MPDLVHQRAALIIVAIAIIAPSYGLVAYYNPVTLATSLAASRTDTVSTNAASQVSAMSDKPLASRSGGACRIKTNSPCSRWLSSANHARASFRAKVAISSKRLVSYRATVTSRSGPHTVSMSAKVAATRLGDSNITTGAGCAPHCASQR